MLRVVASIEARMGSLRLPGKVLADIHGHPALARLHARLRQSERLDGIVLATTENPADDALAEWADSAGLACFRGSEDDVLLRVVEAHRLMNSDVVVEVCGDTPLIDPGVIDMAIDTFSTNECDVVSTTWAPSFPQGIDAQVFPLKALEDVEARVTDPAVREHVSLHFYENPARYRVIHLMAPPRWRAPELRCQLDYPEDLRFINEVYARLAPRFGDRFGVEEILETVRREPHLADINRHREERPTR